MDSTLKEETINSRETERVKVLHKFFYTLQTKSCSNDTKLRPKGKLCPTPLVMLTYLQYLLDIQKIFPNKFEVRTSPKEADSYITNLANEINGNDSDFYIYDIPGFIHLDSLKFPDMNNTDFVIKFKLFTQDLLLNHFSLTPEILPIFASLCSNDYLIIENFPCFSNQIKSYSGEREKTTSIKDKYFQKLTNFILDIYDDIKISDFTENEKESRKQQQKIIIDEILKRKNKEKEEELEQKFKNNLIDSVHEYNLEKVKEYHYNSTIICNDILEGYYSLNAMIKLLKESKKFRCNAYFENMNRKYCWNVTDDLRKQLYEIVLSRNNIGLINDSHLNENHIRGPQKFTITELYRKNSDFSQREVDIWIDVFHSDIPVIKNLPFYLIPITSILRFFLIEKVKYNLFVWDDNDDTYLNFIKYHNKYDNINSSEKKGIISNPNHNATKKSEEEEKEKEPKTLLYWYEFESLVASCVAALTISFLNKRVYSSPKEKNNSSFTPSHNRDSIFKNETHSRDCKNTFYCLNRYNGRSLQLRTPWGIENYQQDLELYNNAVQIYAEFCSIVFLNTNFLQILKIMETQSEYSTFLSMYQYMWEESFYSMISEFKTFSSIQNNKNISFIYNKVFLLDKSSSEFNTNQTINYLSYLQNLIKVSPPII
ncbi:hypothetical protein PIROE2DRAFT_16818 [Piromyces sp. E2]|nr:hypothetical protein PIROE2DRAFT_16818 [Piromyces sp. E2]|eukprot:OUM58023.1 hypothetical protein PIROE2DRAFT_16818 [Piromyces sp. E2]